MLLFQCIISCHALDLLGNLDLNRVSKQIYENICSSKELDFLYFIIIHYYNL